MRFLKFVSDIYALKVLCEVREDEFTGHQVPEALVEAVRAAPAGVTVLGVGAERFARCDEVAKALAATGAQFVAAIQTIIDVERCATDCKFAPRVLPLADGIDALTRAYAEQWVANAVIKFPWTFDTSKVPKVTKQRKQRKQQVPRINATATRERALPPPAHDDGQLTAAWTSCFCADCVSHRVRTVISIAEMRNVNFATICSPASLMESWALMCEGKGSDVWIRFCDSPGCDGITLCPKRLGKKKQKFACYALACTFRNSDKTDAKGGSRRRQNYRTAATRVATGDELHQWLLDHFDPTELARCLATQNKFVFSEYLVKPFLEARNITKK